MRLVNENDILTFDITPQMKSLAKERFSVLSKSQRVYMTDAELLQGFEAEALFEKYFPEAVRSSGDQVYSFDYTLLGAKIEVKNKGCKFRPSLSFEGSVPLYLYERQIPDIYVFTRTSRVDNKAWIVGWMTRSEFDQKKYELRKSNTQDNGLVPRTDTWNVYYRDCKPIKDLMLYLVNR